MCKPFLSVAIQHASDMVRPVVVRPQGSPESTSSLQIISRIYVYMTISGWESYMLPTRSTLWGSGPRGAKGHFHLGGDCVYNMAAKLQPLYTWVPRLVMIPNCYKSWIFTEFDLRFSECWRRPNAFLTFSVSLLNFNTSCVYSKYIHPVILSMIFQYDQILILEAFSTPLQHFFFILFYFFFYKTK